MFRITNMSNGLVRSEWLTLEPGSSLEVSTLPASIGYLKEVGLVTVESLGAAPSDITADDQGTLFSPSSATMTFTYDEAGRVISRRSYAGGVQRVQAIAYNDSGEVSLVSGWIVVTEPDSVEQQEQDQPELPFEQEQQEPPVEQEQEQPIVFEQPEPEEFIPAPEQEQEQEQEQFNPLGELDEYDPGEQPELEDEPPAEQQEQP